MEVIETGETFITTIHIKKEKKYVIATIDLQLSEPFHYTDDLKLKITIIPYLEKSIIILQNSTNNQNSQSVTAKCGMPYDFFGSLIKSKCFKLVINPSEKENISLPLDILLESCIFLHLENPLESINFIPKKDVIKVFSHLEIPLFNDYDESSQPEESYITSLYEQLRSAQSHMSLNLIENQHRALLPELRQYQKKSVAWMLGREKSKMSEQELHLLFLPYKTCDGMLIYAHRGGGFFVKDKLCTPSAIRGGILADEMGLGKTIEVIVLILSNPKSTPSNLVHRKKCGVFKVNETSVEEQSGKLKLLNSTNRKKVASIFVCICGEQQTKSPRESCEKCGLTQHPSCIFKNLDFQPEPYVCPHCAIEEVVQSRATLIVSPASISSQWNEEIEKHTRPGTLKVFCYRGVKEDKFIPPAVLADNDIVIVSYETFRTEVKYIDLKHSYFSEKRHRTKYAMLPSPLASVHWWRICLDEAQMVESSSCKPAEMALRLKADNRWCVTGTPIQKTVTDLFGIFLFLKHEPYCEKLWFKELLFKPFCCGNVLPFVDALMPVFWRTLKKDVYAEIGLMPPITMDVMLKFSALEKYFYDQQSQFCTKQFLERTKNFNPFLKLKSLDRKFLSQIMIPLRRLRQACCHPQAVRGQFSPNSKRIMTMQEISVALVGKAKQDCEMIHRSYISTLNGLAGCCLIQNDLYGAMEAYITALSSINKHRLDFKTDTMLQIHILFNLLEEMKKNNLQLSVSSCDDQQTCSLVFRDAKKIALPNNYTCLEDLESKETTLRKGYLLKQQELLNAAEREQQIIFDQVEEKKSIISLSNNSKVWFQFILFNGALWNKDEELIMTTNNILRKHSSCFSPNLMEFSFRDLNGLLLVCVNMVEKLMSARDKLCQVVQNLMHHPSEADVLSAKECHLMGQTVQNRVKCKFCKAENVFDAYECSLFNVQGNVQTDKRKHDNDVDDNAISSEEEDIGEDEQKQKEEKSTKKKTGTWADGPLEEILKSMLSITSRRVPQEISLEANKNFDLFDTMKKEFKALRSAWMQVLNFVSALDELNMTRSRYRQDSDGSVTVGSDVIPLFMVSTYCQRYGFMKETYHKKVEEGLGRLLFLRNAVKAYNTDVDEKSECCPVCRNSFDSKWAAMCCGHRLCYACLNALMKGLRHNSVIQCPMCRVVTKDCDVLFLDFERERKVNRIFKGSFSSKIFAIVETLVKIGNENKAAKSIIFSSFDEVLYIIMEALKKNDILFMDLTKKKNFEINLQTFKSDGEINVLILPLRAGANGLNIVEAENVLLIEPLLNPGLAEQAVGRIYRIGQKKQTKVYRFIMESSIEERIKESERPHTFETNKDIEGCFTLGELTAFFAA